MNKTNMSELDTFIMNSQIIPDSVKKIHTSVKEQRVKHADKQYLHLYVYIARKYDVGHKVWQYFGKLVKHLKKDDADVGTRLFIKLEEEDKLSPANKVDPFKSDKQQPSSSNRHKTIGDYLKKNSDPVLFFPPQANTEDESKVEKSDLDVLKNNSNYYQDIKRKFEQLSQQNKQQPSACSSNQLTDLRQRSANMSRFHRQASSSKQANVVAPTKEAVEVKQEEPEQDEAKIEPANLSVVFDDQASAQSQDDHQPSLVRELSFKSKLKLFELRATGKL